MDTDELAQVLAYLNAVRAHCGLLPLAEIPLGTTPDATNELGRQCPLAQALPQTVVGADFLRWFWQADLAHFGSLIWPT